MRYFLLFTGLFLLSLSRCSGQQASSTSHSEIQKRILRTQLAARQVQAISNNFSTEEKLAACKLILDDTTVAGSARYAAALEMAKMQTPEAMSALFERLDLKAEAEEEGKYFYPVKGALMKLGEPAIPYLLDFIEKSEDEKKLGLAASAVAKIEEYPPGHFDEFLLANRNKFSVKLHDRLILYAGIN